MFLVVQFRQSGGFVESGFTVDLGGIKFRFLYSNKKVSDQYMSMVRM